MIVGCDSTLLYEAFSRGFRTAFFSLIGHYIDDSSYRFAWPEKTENKGLFWSNIPDEEQLYKVLEYLLYVPEIEWGNQVMKYRDIMGYDPGNTIIKRVLRQHGVQIEG